MVTKRPAGYVRLLEIFLIGILFPTFHTTARLFPKLVAYTVLFVLMKISYGFDPIVLLLAKVTALGFHEALGQNLGRLNESAEKKANSELTIYNTE